MHTIPSLRLQNPICFLPPPVHVYRSSLLLCLCLFLSSFLSENLPLSSSFLRPSSCPLMGLGNSFLQSQGSGHKTMSRLCPLGAPPSKTQETTVSLSPDRSAARLSRQHLCQGSSPGCPCRHPGVQILQGWWPVSLALSLCKKSTKQASLGRGS